MSDIFVLLASFSIVVSSTEIDKYYCVHWEFLTWVSMGMIVSPMESLEPGERLSSFSKYCLYLACKTLINIGRLSTTHHRYKIWYFFYGGQKYSEYYKLKYFLKSWNIFIKDEIFSDWLTDLTLPAGAEVQFPGGLLPVDVGDVLGSSPAQAPPSPPRPGWVTASSPPPPRPRPRPLLTGRPLSLLVRGGRQPGLLQDLLVGRGGRDGVGGVGGLPSSHCGGSWVDPANVSHTVAAINTCNSRMVRDGQRFSNNIVTFGGGVVQFSYIESLKF